MTQTYPLAWPAGWPRTPLNRQQPGNQFDVEVNGIRQPVSLGRARSALLGELLKIGSHIVISCNHQPGAERERATDGGVAVYFVRDGRSIAMACDRFASAAANMRSLALAIAGMRQVERHGGGTMRDKAFAGFVALPPPRSHWDVLGLQPGATAEEIQRAWRGKAAYAHPDRQGGSNAAMAELNAARDAALAEVNAAPDADLE